MASLNDMILKHNAFLEENLETSTLFMTCLAKHGLLENRKVLAIQKISDRVIRNKILLENVLLTNPSTGKRDDFYKFLDALRSSQQHGVVAQIVNYEDELTSLELAQEALEKQLKNLQAYIDYGAQNEAHRPVDNTTFLVQKHTQNVQENPPKTHQSVFPPIEHPSRKASVASRTSYTHVQPGISRQPSVSSSALDFLTTRDGHHPTQRRPMHDKMVVCLQKSHQITLEAVKQLHRSREVIQQLQDRKQEAVSKQLARSEEKASWNVVEAQRLVTDIESRLSQLEEERNEQTDEREQCLQILDSLLEKVKERNAHLGSVVKSPQHAMHAKTSNTALKRAVGKDNKRQHSWQLENKVSELAHELQIYENQEEEVTQKYMTNAQQSKILNTVDSDIDKNILNMQDEEKEFLRSKAKDSTTQAMKRWVENSRAEKHACLTVLSDLECTLKRKIDKMLQDVGPTRLNKRESKLQDRKLATQNSSLLVKKLTDIRRLVSQVLNIQTHATKRGKVETRKAKHQADVSVKSKSKELKQLERRLLKAENERDKYKNMAEEMSLDKKKPKMATVPRGTSYPRLVRVQVKAINSVPANEPSIPKSNTIQKDTSVTATKKDEQKKRALVKPVPRKVETDKSKPGSEKGSSVFFLTEG